MAPKGKDKTQDAPKETQDAPKETARERFVRLANARANRLLGGIATLGKLANGNYEYGSEDVDKLFGALRAELDNAEQKFRQPTTRGKREPVTII